MNTLAMHGDGKIKQSEAIPDAYKEFDVENEVGGEQSPTTL